MPIFFQQVFTREVEGRRQVAIHVPFQAKYEGDNGLCMETFHGRDGKTFETTCPGEDYNWPIVRLLQFYRAAAMPARAPEDNAKAGVSLAIGQIARTQTLKSLRSLLTWLHVTARDVRVVEYPVRTVDSCELACECVKESIEIRPPCICRVVTACPA